MFLKKINKLRISLFAQFYTEERYYRIKGSDGKYKTGTLAADEMFLEWVREEKDVLDEKGQPVIDPISGIPVKEERKERFVPDFDISVTILSEKPTDRNYYTSVAFEMYARQLMTGEDLWYTIEEGKFPPKNDILKHVQTQNSVMQLTQQINQLPPEQQQEFMQVMQTAIGHMVQMNSGAADINGMMAGMGMDLASMDMGMNEAGGMNQAMNEVMGGAMQ